METRRQEVHIDSDDARAGSTNNVGRWVLLFGMVLAIAAMSLAWIIPALS